MERLPEGFGLLPTNFSVRATVLKVIEIKASREGIDLRTVMSQGPAQVSIDEEGIVTGSLGPLRVSDESAFKSLGTEFKHMSVDLSLKDNGEVAYVAHVSTFRKLAGFSVKGTFDIERFLFSDGLIKGAYDPLKNRQNAIEAAVNGTPH